MYIKEKRKREIVLLEMSRYRRSTNQAARRTSVIELFLETVPLLAMIDDEQQLITAYANESMESVLKKMMNAEHAIYCLPIIDEHTKRIAHTVTRLDIIAQAMFAETSDWANDPISTGLTDSSSEAHITDTHVWPFTIDHTLLNLLDPLSKGIYKLLFFLFFFEKTKYCSFILRELQLPGCCDLL